MHAPISMPALAAPKFLRGEGAIQVIRSHWIKPVD
jgi:hypothetical protein